MIVGNHKNVCEYDGAYNCLDCKARWGAYSDAPRNSPNECVPTQPNTCKDCGKPIYASYSIHTCSPQVANTNDADRSDFAKLNEYKHVPDSYVTNDAGRAEFEKFYAAFRMPAEADWFIRENIDDNDYAIGTTNDAWTIYQAALLHARKNAVPLGWKLVPLLPTAEMVRALMSSMLATQDSPDDTHCIVIALAHAIDAAPALQSNQGGEG